MEDAEGDTAACGCVGQRHWRNVSSRARSSTLQKYLFIELMLLYDLKKPYFLTFSTLNPSNVWCCCLKKQLHDFLIIKTVAH